MRRRLLNLLTLLSLLMCVAVVALWVRSYWVYDYAESHTYWTRAGRGHRQEYWAGSGSGRLFYSRQSMWTDDPEFVPLFAPYRRTTRFEAEASWSWVPGVIKGFVPKTFAGFGYAWHPLPPNALKATGTVRALTVPYWAVAAVLALPSAVRSIASRRARRRGWRLKSGLCLS